MTYKEGALSETNPKVIDGLIPEIRVTDKRLDGFIREIEIAGVKFRREGAAPTGPVVTIPRDEYERLAEAEPTPRATRIKDSPEYPCVYCSEALEHYGDRPVGIEAVCWLCWFREYGRDQAVREWKAEHWWRRLVP